MKLLKLSLENFKGVKAFTLEPNGQDCAVYGDNGTGKSTLADAIHWLLFDKNSLFKTAAVKTLDATGKELSGLDHTVEGSFLLDSGKTITLKKTLSENWIKKRGSSEKVFSGHSTDYWVDDVPMKLKEYKAQINSLVPDEELFKLLSSPFYFASVLPWQKRREILLNICGDVTDTNVFLANKELSPLSDLLGDHTIDDFKKIVAEQLRKINKEIQDIPVRIDEANRLLPDLTGMDLAELKNQRAILNKEIKTLTEKLQNIRVDNGAGEVRNQLATLELELQNIKVRERAGDLERVQELKDRLNENEKKQLRLENIIRAGKDAENTSTRHTKRMNDLRLQYHEIAAQQFEPSEMTCDACRQEIPADMQEATFNQWKSTELEEIQSEGKGLKRGTEDLLPIIETGKAAVAEVQEINRITDEIQNGIRIIKEREPAPSEARIQKQAEICAAETRLAEIQNGIDASDEIEAIKLQRKQTQDRVDLIKEEIDKFTQAKDIRARIEQLGNEERELAGKYEEVESQKFLIETFVKTKVELLESRVIEKLNYPGLSVKMFAEQINGGLSEGCDLIFNGVPFNNGLNHGAQIAVGVHIINMLSEHYQTRLPLMIDNCEAITSLPETKTQVVKLIVSAAHKALTVETLNKEGKAA